MIASFYGHTNVVRFLLDHGANTEAMDRYGQTALTLASRGGHREIVRLLEK